jgi:hypothetical protein
MKKSRDLRTIALMNSGEIKISKSNLTYCPDDIDVKEKLQVDLNKMSITFKKKKAVVVIPIIDGGKYKIVFRYLKGTKLKLLFTTKILEDFHLRKEQLIVEHAATLIEKGAY